MSHPSHLSHLRLADPPNYCTPVSPLAPNVQLLVPVGESNYTVYLRAYNAVNNTLSAKSKEYVVSSPDTFDPEDLCPDDIPSVAVGGSESEKANEKGRSRGGSNNTVNVAINVTVNVEASVIPGIIQVWSVGKR